MDNNHKDPRNVIAPESLNLNLDSEHILDSKNKQPSSYSKIINVNKEYVADDQDDMYQPLSDRITRTPYDESLFEKKKSITFDNDSNHVAS